MRPSSKLGQATVRGTALLSLLLAWSACTPKSPPPQSVEQVRVLGGDEIPGRKVRKRIATQPAKRPLGLLRHFPLLRYFDRITVQYQRFDRFVLQRDLERVRRYYRSQGFYDAQVTAGRVIEQPDPPGFVCAHCGQRHDARTGVCPTTRERIAWAHQLKDQPPVRVEIVVDEGEPVLIESARIIVVPDEVTEPWRAEMFEQVQRFADKPVEEHRLWHRYGTAGPLAGTYGHQDGDSFKGVIVRGDRECEAELHVPSSLQRGFGVLEGCGEELELSRRSSALSPCSGQAQLCELGATEVRCCWLSSGRLVRFQGGLLELKPRLEEERLDGLKGRLLRLMTDNGYAHAKLAAKAQVDLGRRAAEIVLTAEPGPKCTFGPLSVETIDDSGAWVPGVGELPESVVRKRVLFAEGETYSTERLARARRELSDLSVFSSVELLPQYKSGEKLNTVVPVSIRLLPIKLRAIKVGLGAELGTRLEGHLVGGWEDRNFLGGSRLFSVDARIGAVIFPMKVENLFTQAPTDLVPEAELSLRFKQPSFPEALTDLLLNVKGRIYAPDSRRVPDPVPEGYNIVGYYELGGSVGLDRRWRIPVLTTQRALQAYLGSSTLEQGGFIKLQLDQPFSYNLDEEPEGYSSVLIPLLETRTQWDMRKGKDQRPNSVEPHSGLFFANQSQVAALGDAEDVRLRPEVRVYAGVSDELTLALRWSAGFLFAFNYGDSLAGAAMDDVSLSRDLQLLSFRAFFSGGPYSNRGYGYREVGPHAIFPTIADSQGADVAWLPSGGLGMWEASAELRIPTYEKLSTVVFIDTSDVVRTLGDFRLTHPHISPGLGLRLKTPVGPLRFDVGVRVPYIQEVGKLTLSPDEGGNPDGSVDDFPLAFALAIGHAF